MSDKMTNVIMGVSVVVLGYALLQHFKGSGAAGGRSVLGGTGAPISGNDPTRPDPGYGYDPYNPGDLILSKDLINGTIADYYAGQKAGDEIPWSGDLINSTIGDYYNVKERPGDFMRVGWW